MVDEKESCNSPGLAAKSSNDLDIFGDGDGCAARFNGLSDGCSVVRR